MTVYSPSEDTYFLRDFLEENIELEGKKFLEIGTGSGEIAIHAAESGAEVTAVDINPEALEQVREKAEDKGLEIELVESDLFEELEEGDYDVVVFNPPYLPGEEGMGDEEIWRGGEKGVEVSERFLDEVETFLSEDGSFFIVASSLAEYRPLIEEFNLTILDEEELWFETLYILGK
jgi:release factor glutamine methyltransferase